MSKVEVRPIEREKWHKKSGRESFSRSKVVEVLYDVEAGRYATGLTEEEAEIYGKQLGVDLSDMFDPAVAHPYWSSKAAAIELKNQTMLFDTNKPSDYVKVKNMKASKFVANSLADYNANLYPDATHIIYDEAEEVDVKATKVQVRTQATIAASKLSTDDKLNMIQLLSKKSMKGRSTNFIDVEIADIIETKPEEFLRWMKMGKEEVYARAMVAEGIYRNILTKEATAVYYMGELIGMTEDEAVEWFKNPQNQKIKVAILERLNGKK